MRAVSAAALAVLLLIVAGCGTASRVVAPQPERGPGIAVASWYGREFQGKRTSSGEPFDMYAYTCAHRTYPFGTRIQITHLANDKTVECVVNDRGPFVEGRDIDVSYAVAREIGLIGPGVSRVQVEVNGRDESYIRKASVQASGGTGPFAVQVGAFLEQENAVRLKRALKLAYENVYIQTVMIDGEVFHRVRIGDVGVIGDAIGIAERLAGEGYEAVVVRASSGPR